MSIGFTLLFVCVVTFQVTFAFMYGISNHSGISISNHLISQQSIHNLVTSSLPGLEVDQSNSQQLENLLPVGVLLTNHQQSSGSLENTAIELQHNKGFSLRANYALITGN